MLLYFVQNPGKVLTRDELLKNVWPDSFVDENSLAQSISALRRALEEKPGDNNYIVTLPGRGYQFVAPVQVVASENLSTVPDAATPSGNLPSGLLLQKHTIQTSVITTNKEKEQLSLPGPRSRRRETGRGLGSSRGIGCRVLRMAAVPPSPVFDAASRHKFDGACLPRRAVPSPFSVFATCLAVPKKAGCPRPWRKC